MIVETRRQLYAAIVVSINTFIFGMSYALMNVSSIQLPSGRLTAELMSKSINFIQIGTLFGNFSCLYIVGKYGLKMPLMLLAIPQMVGWFLALFAENIYWLYLSRSIIGFSSGIGAVLIPSFIADISFDETRGAMCTISNLLMSSGNLFGLLFSAFPNYRIFATSILIFPILFVLLLSFIPETPVTLRKWKRHKEAEASLLYYKGVLENMQNIKITKNEYSTNDRSLFMFRRWWTPATKHAILLTLTLAMFTSITGLGILILNVDSIIAAVGTKLDPIATSMNVAMIQVMAGGICLILIDTVGRKFLLIFSLAGAAVAMFFLSIFHFFKDEIPETHHIQLNAVMLTIFIGSIGIMISTYVLVIDILPQEIRIFMIVAYQVITLGSGLAMNSIFHYLLPIVKLHGCFLMFADICLAAIIFTLIYVPETKQKSWRKIRKMLENH